MSKQDLSRREMFGITIGLSGLALTTGPASISAREEDRQSKIAVIDAKPEPVEIDLARTAVIVVDMQNDFGAEGGMFHRAGVDISKIQAAVGPTRKVVTGARDHGIQIVYLKMAFKPDLSDAGPKDSPILARGLKRFRFGENVKTPNGAEGRILIRDTWNTDILNELTPKSDDIVLYKPRFSGFFRTELDAILTRLRVRHLVFTGCTTSTCVESTIRDARFRDYLPVLLADCTAEPVGSEFARSNHDASLYLIERSFGWVSSSDAFVKGLAKASAAANKS